MKKKIIAKCSIVAKGKDIKKYKTKKARASAEEEKSIIDDNLDCEDPFDNGENGGEKEDNSE